MPPDLGETHDPLAADDDAFRDEQLRLEVRGPAEAAEPAPRRNYPMVGKAGFVRPAHHLPDRPGRPRTAGPFGDVPIGGDTSRRNSPEHVQHFAREWRRGHAR